MSDEEYSPFVLQIESQPTLPPVFGYTPYRLAVYDDVEVWSLRAPGPGGVLWRAAWHDKADYQARVYPVVRAVWPHLAGAVRVRALPCHLARTQGDRRWTETHYNVDIIVPRGAI